MAAAIWLLPHESCRCGWDIPCTRAEVLNQAPVPLAVPKSWWVADILFCQSASCLAGAAAQCAQQDVSHHCSAPIRTLDGQKSYTHAVCHWHHCVRCPYYLTAASWCAPCPGRWSQPAGPKYPQPNVQYDPWIPSYVLGKPPCDTGFCPVSYIAM